MTDYVADKKVCAACPLRAECTQSKVGRSVARHWKKTELEIALAFARLPEAQADRRRRRHLMEGSFAQAANCHHFKRARWRRLWRQQIQDWLIAACQNIKLLLRHRDLPPGAAAVGRVAALLYPIPAQSLLFHVSALARFLLNQIFPRHSLSPFKTDLLSNTPVPFTLG